GAAPRAPARTLTAPAAYSTLYVIASSGDGTSTSVGSGIIRFADGSTQAFSYNTFDWCNGQGDVHPEAVLAGLPVAQVSPPLYIHAGSVRVGPLIDQRGWRQPPDARQAGLRPWSTRDPSPLFDSGLIPKSRDEKRDCG